ncbi:MAG: hypothetical protein CVV42_03170 [Candidatus Riflebacteria bacterium HGW-Riflebacteria-2]|jgi:hypothetical protein|nr:MAG: hypothetical protein CVV42_03170 [Candidatus Riflebacteria bacterium HGW-Riflebacteria-2]
MPNKSALPGSLLFLKTCYYRYKIIMAIAVILVMLSICGCSGISKSKTLSSGPAQTFDDLEAGKIQGTVTANAGGNPVKGAIIETFEKQAVADENGLYLLGPVPAGDYRVIARASGYSLGVKDEVRVLSGRITENINFSLPAQTAEHSADFSIMALVPFSGSDGELVTIYCRGCGSNKGRVTFNGKEATVIDWNSQLDDRIVVQAPAEVETGPVRVIINGETSKETQPLLFIGRPVILRAEPIVAQGGQLITIYGRNFNPIDRFNRVKLKDTDCMVTAVIDEKTLQVQLPVNARTGLLSIRIESNEYQLEGISSQIITIKPILVHISPKRAVPNVPLTLYGYNFGDNRNDVKVLFGTYEIAVTANDSFSDNKIVIKVPDTTVLAPGATIDVKVKVNDASSNALSFTAYNTANVTLADYGIYDFDEKSVARTLRIESLAPTDRIAFLSVLSGAETEDLDGTFYYSFSGYLGGNFDLVPILPGSMRAATVPARHPVLLSSSVLTGSAVNPSSNLRAALTEPASETINIYLRDFTSADPWDVNNDILATATLVASSTKTLVYFESTTSALTPTDAAAIATEFDRIYANLATACWDGLPASLPPEGNVDDQPRIAILVSATLDQAAAASGELLVCYFDPRDKDLTASTSAGTEIIYANPTSYTRERSNFYGSLAQTLSGMMYFNQKGDEGTSWQNAGIGVFARQVAGYGFLQKDQRIVSYVSQYMQYPETVSLNHWPDEPAYADYGMQYLFTQYLFDHCGGYNAIASLEERRAGSSGLVDVNNYLVFTGYSGLPKVGFREFFHNFGKALYCDDLGLVDGFVGYNKERHQFSSINLRGGTSGIEGLRGTPMGENPVTTRSLSIKGFGCSLVEYNQGNWGDLEVTIDATPAAGNFKTWVIYYSGEQIASTTIGL